MVFKTFLFQFENKLLPFKTHDAGQQVLTEKEFMDAIDQFVPLSNEKLRKKLYWESETAVRFDGLRDVVPISRLARILDLYYHKYIYDLLQFLKHNLAFGIYTEIQEC